MVSDVLFLSYLDKIDLSFKDKINSLTHSHLVVLILFLGNSGLKVGRLERAQSNSEGFRSTLSEERQRGPKGDKMAENNARREEQPETGSEEETSSREYSTDSEGTVGEVQGEPKKRG
jgi:hypothetical protein